MSLAQSMQWEAWGQIMRVLVVDDEPLARTALANILSARNDVDSFEVASDAVEALDKLGRSSYDLLLLDINMPELSGIDFVDQLKQSDRPLPSIVFVTAHQQHAVTAFEQRAADYVLKPFSNERVDEALDVAFRKTVSERATRLMGIAPQLQRAPRPSPRIAIKAKGRILFIDPGVVMAVQAEGNYVLLQREVGSYLLRESISEMAEKLEPYGFIRIHRSVLVNTSFVEEIQPCPTGEYELRVKGGKQYTVTRTYKKNLKSLAEFWIGTSAFLTD
jgi:two-component system, LytTR family, response regulator